MDNNKPNNPEVTIRNLVNQEERYAKLIKEYRLTQNPATLKEINRMHRGLSRAWDEVRATN